MLNSSGWGVDIICSTNEIIRRGCLTLPFILPVFSLQSPLLAHFQSRILDIYVPYHGGKLLGEEDTQGKEADGKRLSTFVSSIIHYKSLILHFAAILQ